LTLFSFEDKKPKIGQSAYLHESATIIGNVSIGEECFIGAGAVLRGDYGSIVISDRTSIQENCVLHARENDVCKVASDVQVGHAAILHNCEIGEFAVVGLGSRICDFARIGVWSIVGEGAVVPTGAIVPDGKVAVGIPARVIRDVSDEDKALWSSYKQKYAELCRRYRKSLVKI
jgi:phenylacetic acid degradation protein